MVVLLQQGLIQPVVDVLDDPVVVNQVDDDLEVLLLRESHSPVDDDARQEHVHHDPRLYLLTLTTVHQILS